MALMTALSRNRQGPKGAQSARARFHVHFPIDLVADAEAYAGLKKQLTARFEFIDPNAIDAGRFIYVHDYPSITVVEGERSTNDPTAPPNPGAYPGGHE